jgi:putative transposase
MSYTPERFYHVYNQGNNRQKLFEPETDDYIFFLTQVRKFILPHVDILAYCLMPNHFHFLIKTDHRCLNMRMSGKLQISEVSFGLKMLLSTYTRIVNKRRGGTGSLFRQGTHSRCLVHDPGTILMGKANQDDLTNVFHYIHDNPVVANLVGSPEAWEYSSYRDYAGLRNGTLVNKQLSIVLGLV